MTEQSVTIAWSHRTRQLFGATRYATPDVADANGLKPLMLAAALTRSAEADAVTEATDIDAVTALIAQGLAPNSTNADGMPPIHHAAGNARDPEILRHLASHGAVLDARDAAGLTVMHHIAAPRRGAKGSTIASMNLGTDPDARASASKTLLHLAAEEQKTPASPGRTDDRAGRPRRA